MSRKVAVLGGGISGLSTAFFLKKLSKHHSLSVTLYEASSRPGGWIKRKDTDDNGIPGDPINFGPKTIRLNKSKALPILYMLDSLGLYKNVISTLNLWNHFKTKDRKTHLVKHIFNNDRMCNANPLNMFATSNFFTFEQRIDLAKKILNPPFEELGEEDMSVHDFYTRYFSPEFADLCADPMTLGVHGCSSKDASMQWCCPGAWLYTKEGRKMLDSLQNPFYGRENLAHDVNFRLFHFLSKKRENTPMFLPDFITIPDGVFDIIVRLLELLKKDDGFQFNPHLNSKIDNLSFSNVNDKLMATIEIDDKNRADFDHVFSTIPSFSLASILPKENMDLITLLDKVKYSSLVSVYLEYNRKKCIDIVRNNMGFGVLVPSINKTVSPIIGIVFDSSLEEDCDKKQTSKFTVMLGGSNFTSPYSYSDSSKELIIQHCINVFSKHLTSSDNYERHSFEVSKNSLPLPHVGYSKTIEQINELSSNLPLSISGSFITRSSVHDIVYQSMVNVIKYLEKEGIYYYEEKKSL